MPIPRLQRVYNTLATTRRNRAIQPSKPGTVFIAKHVASNFFLLLRISNTFGGIKNHHTAINLNPRSRIKYFPRQLVPTY